MLLEEFSLYNLIIIIFFLEKSFVFFGGKRQTWQITILTRVLVAVCLIC
jgi:hypothetical protein